MGWQALLHGAKGTGWKMSCGHISRSLDHPYPRSHNAGILRSLFYHWSLFPPIFLPTNWAHLLAGSKATQTQVEAPDFLKVLMALISVFQEKLPAVLVCQTSVGGYAKTQRGVLGRSGFRDGTSHRLPKHEGMVGWSAIERLLAKSGPRIWTTSKPS